MSTNAFHRPAAVVLASIAAVGALAGLAGSAYAASGLSVSITSPAGGQVRGTVTVTASASASAGVRSVEFFVDGRSIGTDTTAPYSLTRDSRQLPDGTKLLTARVVDKSGAQTASAARTVEVHNAATVTPSPMPTPTVRSTATPTPTPTPAPTATTVATPAPMPPAQTVTPMPVGVPVASPTATPSPTPAGAAAPVADAFGTSVVPWQPYFSNSVFTTGVRQAPVAYNSAAIVSDLASQVARFSGGVASLNVWQYNASVLTVSAYQKRVRVAFDDCQHKGYTPKVLYGLDGQFEDVPVPDDAVPSTGSDAAFSIWSPSSDQYWDFWKAKRTATGWSACWGGRIDHVSASPGYFVGGTGASATGIAGAAGMLSVRDVQNGRADHAIAVAIPDVASWKTFSWPAQRSDGSASSHSLVMEGQRFRLDPTIDVDRLNLTAVGKVVAHAAQDYGIVITDKSGVVAIGAENGVHAQALTGTNPWPGLMGKSRSYNVLAGFPWAGLQALPVDYGKPAN